MRSVGRTQILSEDADHRSGVEWGPGNSYFPGPRLILGTTSARTSSPGPIHRHSGSVAGLQYDEIMSLPARPELPGGVTRHSVTLPAAISEAVRSRVGARGFSSYVATAVARQLEQDALDDTLARMEAKYGPVDEEAVAAIMAQLAR